MYGIDAHRAAANLGVPQLVVNNAQENSDVEAALFAQNIFPANNRVWMGITDSGTTYNWRTFDGSPLPAYTHWATGEPNNQAPGCYNAITGCAFCTGADAFACAYREGCAVLDDGGNWLDITCKGTNIVHIAVLELNTCPVIAKPRDTAICAGNAMNLTGSVISGGTPPYTYTWNPGSLTGSPVSVSPTTTTTYSVEASDHYLCKADTTVTISVSTNTPPTINASAANVCKNTNDNISLSTVSGTATYSWNFGGGTISSGSGGGPYAIQWSTGGTKTISVTVTDNGCVTTATKTVRVDSANAAFTINPTSICAGQNVTVTVTTVSATANYTWSFGGGTVASGSGAGPYSVNWPSSGTQTIGLTVTDNGCNANSSSTVSITTAPIPAFTLNPASTACQGEPVSVTLSGAASGTATYTWSFGGGNVISGSGAGPYSVSWSSNGTKTINLTVTDGGCQGTATQSISINNTLTADAGPDVQLCPGVPGTLGAPATSGYTYSWTPTFGLSSATSSNPTIMIPVNPLGTVIDTVYVVTATLGACSATDTVRVRLYPTPVSSFNINPSTTCVNSNVTVTYTGTPSGTATYTWSFGGGNVVSGSGAGPYTVNWAFTGTQAIDLTVTDNGCSSNSTNNVTISNSLNVAFTLNPASTACAGQPVAVTLTGAASGTATYNWNFNGGNVISGSGAGPYSISWSTNGSQSIDLTVTDGGCSGNATQSITIANTATANAGADIQLCPGVMGNLGSPATSGYSYSWSPAFGLSSATVSDPTITIPSNPTGAIIDTFYVVTVTSGTCSASDTVLVRIYPDIDNSFVVSSPGTCTGQDITITYAGTPSATATYNWNFGGANITSGSGDGPYTLNWTTSGSKTITLDVTDNGCTNPTTGSTTVSVGTRPIANAGSDQTICSGIQAQLGSPAVPGVTYAWTPATYLSSTTVADPTFTETNTGTTPDVTRYMLIADGGGCPDTAYVNMTVTPVSPMSIVLSGPATFCQGDSVILSDNLAPQADYSWSTTETTSTITVKSSGTYTLTAHDFNGCVYISSPSVVITVNPKPTVSLAPGGEIDESCQGANDGSLTVQASNGTAPYTYSWSTTPSQSGTTISGLTPGSYQVSVTDNSGCSDTATFVVNPAPFFAVNVDSFRNLSCNNQSDGAIYASVNGGTPPVSYLWSNNFVSAAITSLSAGTYSVTATDARGCAADTSIILAQPVPIRFTPVSPLHMSYGGSEQIEINITPAANYDYSWSPATALSCTNCPNPVASPVQTTIYILTVTDPIGGCSGIDTITLYVDPTKSIFIPNAFTPNGDGINDVYSVYASGPVKVFEMEIFNRWGEKVYQSNDMGGGWDGKYMGTFVMPGEYVYQTTFTFLDGQTLANKGSLTVLR